MKLVITLDKKGLTEAASEFVEGMFASPLWKVTSAVVEYDTMKVTGSDENPVKESSNGS